MKGRRDTMDFTVRTTAPTYGDKYWVINSKGGWCANFNERDSSGWLLPNCTSYCWGRWSEVNGWSSWPTARNNNSLPTGNAGDWIELADKTQWEVKSIPTPGCICVWKETNGPGHVSFVEKVETLANGALKIWVSESNAAAVSDPSRWAWRYTDYNCNSNGDATGLIGYTFAGYLTSKTENTANTVILILLAMLYLRYILTVGAKWAGMYKYQKIMIKVILRNPLKLLKIGGLKGGGANLLFILFHIGGGAVINAIGAASVIPSIMAAQTSLNQQTTITINAISQQKLKKEGKK